MSFECSLLVRTTPRWPGMHRGARYAYDLSQFRQRHEVGAAGVLTSRSGERRAKIGGTGSCKCRDAKGSPECQWGECRVGQAIQEREMCIDDRTWWMNEERILSSRARVSEVVENTAVDVYAITVSTVASNVQARHIHGTPPYPSIHCSRRVWDH